MYSNTLIFPLLTEHTLFDPSDTASDLLISDQPIKRQLHFDPDITSIMG